MMPSVGARYFGENNPSTAAGRAAVACTASGVSTMLLIRPLYVTGASGLCLLPLGLELAIRQLTDGHRLGPDSQGRIGIAVRCAPSASRAAQASAAAAAACAIRPTGWEARGNGAH